MPGMLQPEVVLSTGIYGGEGSFMGASYQCVWAANLKERPVWPGFSSLDLTDVMRHHHSDLLISDTALLPNKTT